MEKVKAAHLIKYVSGHWPVNSTRYACSGVTHEGSALLVTIRSAPPKLGLQTAREMRGEAEAAPRRERVRAISLDEEIIIM
jgi:hypothetical protein